MDAAGWSKRARKNPRINGGPVGGAKEIRTPDLFDANEALYQLSYSPGSGRNLDNAQEGAEPVSLGYKFSRPNAN